MAKQIFFSVGEPSGDQHAARMVSEILRIDPSIRVRGFGGQAMQSAGCQIDRDLTQHAVVGLIEVLPKLRQFIRFANQAEQIFRSGQIDAVVLVDFPGFNWHIAKRAKRYGIPVYYYCPPQLWAWAGWRIRKLRRSVDHVLAVLPMEQRFFQAHNVSSTFVGHPFFDAVAAAQLDEQVLARLRHIEQAGETIVAVLPGSRDHEVHRNWPIMLQSIRQLHTRHPKARFLVASYRDRQCLWCREQLDADDQSLPIEFYVDRTSEIVEVARCAMMVSGSVSLELMARGTPAAVVYRVGRLLHAVANMMVRLDSITLPNLIARRKVFPEMVSVGATAPAVEFLTETIDAMLGDAYYYQQVTAQLDGLREQYARPGASQRAARWLCQEIGSSLPGVPERETIPVLPPRDASPLRRAA